MSFEVIENGRRELCVKFQSGILNVRYSQGNEEVLEPSNAFQGCRNGSERDGKAETIQTNQHSLGNQKEIQQWWGKYYLKILKDCLWDCFRISKCTAEKNMLWNLWLWWGKFVVSVLFTVQTCCWIMLLLFCYMYYSVFTCLLIAGMNVSLESCSF